MSLDFAQSAMADLPLQWVIFWCIFPSAIVLDYFLNKGKELTLKSASLQTLFYIAIALLFGAFVYMDMGAENGAAWYSIWALEYSLSFDNLFVIDVVMVLLGITAAAQQRTLLYWGIVGAIVLRGAAILAGTAVIEQYWWVLPLMGVFLLITAVKLFEEAIGGEEEGEDEEPFFVRLSKAFRFPLWFINLLRKLNSPNALVQWLTNFRLGTFATAILAVELTDIGFAVDSLPTGFSISQNPFIVFTANMMAIMGLRSLFFCMQALKSKFRFLGLGVSVVLAVIGVKIIAEHLGQIVEMIDDMHLHDIEVSTTMSLGVIVAILLSSVFASLLMPEKQHEEVKVNQLSE